MPIGPRFLIVASATVCSLAADLPVREVVLYKNGVGYFERGGQVPAGESARLDFRTDDMNDILKSLTVRDASGGSVAGVRYDSALPVDQKLKDYPFQLGSGQPLWGLLDQVKGARAEFRAGPSVVLGAITTSRQIKGADGADREVVTILTDNGELKTVDLASVTSIQFSDPELQAQLKSYLTSLTASRSREKKSIYLDSANDRARDLSVSYLAPAPIWKTSYRLLFDKAGAATLEGWAIVDNTTADDWTNVRLALVSGRPVSYISRLYEPRFVSRMSMNDQDVAVVQPKQYAGALAAAVPERVEVGGIGAGVYRTTPPAGQMSADRFSRAEASTAAIQTEAREAGELFEYRFSTPVTVRRNSSAMLPFLQDKVTTRRLLIWSSSGDEQFPRNAAEITNNTGKTLDAGPVTVFDNGSYGGEAPIGLVKQGDKRLIGYALDQGTRVEDQLDSEDSTEREIRLNRGILTVRVARRVVTTYNIRNVDAKDKKLIIEHPLNTNSKVIGAQPVETTSEARRFEIALRPRSDEKLTVTEEEPIEERHEVASMTPDVLLVYRSSKAISDAGRRALEQVAAKKSAIGQTVADIDTATREQAEIAQDQNRLRENIRSLGSIAGQQEQVQRYATQLADQETQIATLRDRLAALRKQRQAQQDELNALIEKLTF